MGRRLRFVPEGSLVEVTTRTVQGRCLMRPTQAISDLIRGALARAARLFPVEVHAFCFLSNHYHLLLTVPNAERLAAFMNHLNSNIAREVGREVAWREKFWGRRYQATLVSHEEAAQVERLTYLLRQGCKENLVRSPLDWPGASSTAALLRGCPIRGAWIDRTRRVGGPSRGTGPDRSGVVTTLESLELAPLPCWRNLPAKRRRTFCYDLVRAIEEQTVRRARDAGIRPLGRKRLRRQDPHARVNLSRKGPAPLAHAATRTARQALRDRYRAFVAAFRRASARLRDRGAEQLGVLCLFPPGSFPPRIRLSSRPAAA